MENAGTALERFTELTDGYTPPDWACNSFRALYDGLNQLEKHMHQHVHKETNVLFVRALAACVGLMTLPRLCDHLEDAHRNLYRELERLDPLTKNLAKEHAPENPKLLIIPNRFVMFQRRFKAHLRKESEPLLRVCRRSAASRSDARRARSFLKPSLEQLHRGHRHVDEALSDLRSSAAGEAPSPSEQSAVRPIADAVARLEHFVHEQIHKEGQVPFPRALALEAL